MSECKTHTDLIVAPVDEAAAAHLATACNLGPLVSRVLVARGIDTPDAARAFLSPSLERDWVDPARIPGMLQVADCLQAAIEAGKRILVFGDFDVDGITATAISVRALHALGAQAQGLIPHRYDEGYALSDAAIERGMAYEPDLIMTVDCGISCAVEVEGLLARGVEVCITDHHEPGDAVPVGIPLTDPKLDPDCPSRDLAGAGVALKLFCLLGERMGKPDLWLELTDLAALGTIADLMPLLGENRALVAHGLARMRNVTRVGLAALASVCAVEPDSLTATRLSFSLIPRLNAAGRMQEATIAYDLLMCDEVEQAQRIAVQLEVINDLRRQTESELNTQVEEQLVESYANDPLIVAAGEGWHEGVKGIVASRIARARKKPVIIFSIEDGQARGSGRTYGDINLFELASSCSDLFEKFGGHAAAIGITLPASKLDELRQRLCDQVLRMQSEAPAAGVHVDAIARVEECTVEQFAELELLQPCGNGNPTPLLALHGVFLEDRGAVGKQANHFRFNASDGTAKVPGIFFGPDDLQNLIDCTTICDVVFEPNVDEYRGRKTPKLMTKDILLDLEPAAPTSMDARIEELFSMQDEVCATGDYAGITQVARFNTKVVGVTYENRQEVLATLEAGIELALRRDAQNEYDANAIAVTLLDGTQIGYLNKHLAKQLAPAMDSGIAYDAAISDVTGGPASPHADVRAPGPLGVRDPGVVDRSYGVNIIVRRVDLDMANPVADAEQVRRELDEAKARWQSVPASELEDALRTALIGNHTLHDAQAHALDALARGRNTLAIMATGRGKSLIFHLHAARMALLEGKACVFIYPLRALVADQAFHLQETFAQFGLVVSVLTGESSEETRKKVYAGLADGSVNCVLTTPEFLSIHADRFAQSGRIGFVVVDEAHHVALARAGNRSAYATLDATLAALGNPLVLAVTATSGTQESQVIRSVLSIDELILDPTVRENLHIDDHRDIRSREQYLASIVASGEKCVVYVNSRDQSLSLTRMLRKRLPSLAPYVGFYNAGLSKADRKAIEDAFRSGELRCIISTSAFGEGIDIPDIEHVVLYHLPFNDIEFNQMSGRAGRDGRDATIHLLFGYGDARINENILESGAPPRNALVVLYRILRELAQEASERGETGFSCTNRELAERAMRLDRRDKLDESSVSCGISVFRELGFVETSGASVARRITLVPSPGHMELEESVRYREGLEELETFKSFKSWALKASAQQLLEKFNRPILPDDGA